jgi:CRISPR-associated protein Csm1
MDDTVLKIAVAAFMHDIGKFAEDNMEVTRDYLDRNAGLYQPFFNGHHSHRHAVYTAAFIENFGKLLPRQFDRSDWGTGDILVNLAAGHHLPETPLQWIIATADRMSSGWDRDTFDKEYNRAVPWKDYKKTRLLPIFEVLLRQESAGAFHYKYSYPLKEISPLNIFPELKDNVTPAANKKAAEEYKVLFDGFVASLKKLRHRDENIELWLNHFESLMLLYTWSIPAARAGDIVPDVSLYDHSKSTAVLATALYCYHADTNTLEIDAIKNDDPRKFLLVSGDFFGIQRFIFSDSGEAGKRRSKILRGRSFMVSLFSELAADMLCRRIGIPSTSIILNAAGKFTLIAPNTADVRETVKNVESDINDWLIKMTCGENALGITTIEAAQSDFVSGRFIELYDRLQEKMAERKFHKYDLNRHGGAVEDYLDRFDSSLEPPLCPYCGKRPSSREAEEFREDDKSLCSLCRDHIFLGERIVRGTRIAICTKDADIKGAGSKLLEPVFGEYQVAFIEGGLAELAREGTLLKYWDIGINETGQVAKDISARFINGYVPVYDEDDCDNNCTGEEEKHSDRPAGMIEQEKGEVPVIGMPKTFSHIASKALNPDSETAGRYRGVEALGVLKADVDRLGMLFSCGIPRESVTLSRFAALSRQMDYFFTLYLPFLLVTDSRFTNIYTVFAGGDDLFLIGPWNRIIELASFLKERFAEYTCRNPEIHFSAGISIQKDHTPLDTMAKDTEDALERAKREHTKEKEQGRKTRGNSITLFGEKATWDEFADLITIVRTLRRWMEEGMINNAMLYRMNGLVDMAARAADLLETRNGEITVDDMECLKWRALFKYTTERNIAKHVRSEEQKKLLQRDFEQAAGWLETYGGRLRIALWQVMYNNR